MISKLQHITQGSNPEEHLTQIETFCKAGGKWTQLRIKNCGIDDYIKIANEARRITSLFDCVLIINDHIEVAKAVKADGVHLGKTDTSTEDARKALGNNVIIGRTCNTMNDIIKYHKEAINYIGLGPFRFTQTKKQLDPILGLEGYRTILNTCVEKEIKLPVIAIGGIEINDLPELFQTGIYGVAISSAINKYPQDIKQFLNLLK